MQLDFQCPRCERLHRAEIPDAETAISCPACDWARPLDQSDLRDDSPQRCLACGCQDLWRQKDFSQRLGLALVGLGILVSTIFWYRMQPAWAIGTLMAFALADLVLYWVMPDVLVCYRCGARHRQAAMDDDHPRFNLELHERYRQEAIRLGEANRAKEANSAF